MSYTIRPSAEVDFTKAPTVAIAGPTGSGKTESALRLARGYVGPKGKFLIVDTEEKRALYKRDRYQPWDWMDLQPPFTPQNYIGALEAAKGYDAVIVDSGSHEYSGPGGMQDMQLEDLERMSRGDAAKMERLTAPAWKRAKLEHKKMMAHLIRYPTLLIAACARSRRSSS
jgi:energy-coupling factor transporter ATP-binding protein EcfA2